MPTDSQARLSLETSTLIAYATVSLLWGSTYLGIRVAIDTMPPFLMAGVRFTVAGLLMYVWARYRSDAPRPTAREWRGASIVGLLLMVGGNVCGFEVRRNFKLARCYFIVMGLGWNAQFV